MPPPGSVREAVANAPLCAALVVPPAPAADVAKRPRDAEPGPSAPPKVPKQRAAKGQSDGVVWDKKAGKWRGCVVDPSQHYSSGKPKLLRTTYFKDRAACVEARAALLAATNTKNAARLAAMAAADPTTRGLPPRPEHAADAEVGVVYYGPATKKAPGAACMTFRPARCVRAGIRTPKYMRACLHGEGADACAHQAHQTGKGSVREYCVAHGAKCPHGKEHTMCWQCNAGAGCFCAGCGDKHINKEHQLAHGGSGRCATCRETAAAEQAAAAAAANGAFDAASTAVKKVSRRGKMEAEMCSALVSAGYHRSFRQGMALRPGEFLRQVHFDFKCAFGKAYAYGEKRCAYIDFVVCPLNHGMLVCLEVDEHEHNTGDPAYTVQCETARMWNVSNWHELSALGAMRFVWLRVNPDTTFTIGNDKYTPSMATPAQRCEAVANFLCTMDSAEYECDDSLIHVLYAFYQMHTDFSPKVIEDPTYAKELRPRVFTLEHRIDETGITLCLGDQIQSA